MPKLIHQETLCCNYKRCPTVKIFEDGSVEIADDNVEGKSIGSIKLQPEQLTRLVELIQNKK